MQQYKDLIEEVFFSGREKMDSSGTGTLSIFGHQSRYDLREGFPLLTTKKLHLRSIIHELLWFISGDTNNNTLKENGVSIWNEWEKEGGDLGPIYGYQWRKWPAYRWKGYEGTFGGGNEGEFEFYNIDQLQQAINTIRTNPDNRRIIVSAWNVADIEKMALPPCHSFFQFNCTELNEEEREMYYDFYRMPEPPKHGLSLQLYQRSADIGLGVPFNIASYALLLMMVAKVTNTVPFEFIHTLGDAHIYKNHLRELAEQIERPHKALPEMIIHGDQKEIDDFKFDDFELTGYDPHPHIKLPVAVVK